MDLVPAGRISVADAYERLLQAAHRRRNPKRYEHRVDQSEPIAAASDGDVGRICYTLMSDALRVGTLRMFSRPEGWIEDATVSPKAFAEPDALPTLLLPQARPDASAAKQNQPSIMPYFLDERDFERWLSAAMPKPPLAYLFSSVDEQHWLKWEYVSFLLLSGIPLECCERNACDDTCPQFLRTWAERDFLSILGIKSGQDYTTLIPAIEWQHMQFDRLLHSAKHDRFGPNFYTDLIYHRGQVEELLPTFARTIAHICRAEIEQPIQDGSSPPPQYSDQAFDWIQQLAKEPVPAPTAPKYIHPLEGPHVGLSTNPASDTGVSDLELATESQYSGGARRNKKVKPGRPPDSGIIYIRDKEIAAAAKKILALFPTMKKAEAIGKAADKLGHRVKLARDIDRIRRKL